MRDARGRGAARRIGGRVVRWAYRNAHRIAITEELAPEVASLTGLCLDVGGGTDSPLAASWQPGTRRIRLDIEAEPPPEVLADAARLPVRSGVADAVVMSEVLEHVADPWAAVDEVHRVLRPGGRFIGSVPFIAQGLHADPFDYYRYTDTGLEHLLRSFTEVQVVPHGNAYGVAWRMVFARHRWLVFLNPLMRRVSRTPDAINAEGYVFTARKGGGT